MFSVRSLELVERLFLRILWRRASINVLAAIDHMLETHVVPSDTPPFVCECVCLGFFFVATPFVSSFQMRNDFNMMKLDHVVASAFFAEFDSSCCNLIFAINLLKAFYGISYEQFIIQLKHLFYMKAN